ncbi:MAG TPA: hypothetical protein DIT67_02920 [Octadecabacter sp.]|nr:hypothetical protein [Octadecabacter sp.]
MLRATLLGTAVLLTLSGCAQVSESRFNPFNWFGNSTEAAVINPSERRPLVPEGRSNVTLDGRELVQSITSLSVDRAPSGAIVRAIGSAETQGFFNAELVSRGVENGVLMLEFRAQRPTRLEVPGTPRSRQISAAYAIDGADLSGIRTVRVQAATNARTSGR